MIIMKNIINEAKIWHSRWIYCIFSLRYNSNPKLYKEKVEEIVKTSQEKIYDLPSSDDKHYITFEPYEPLKHDAVRTAMINQAKEERQTKIGHSWVASGSFKPLSRAPSPNSESESWWSIFVRSYFAYKVVNHFFTIKDNT